MVMAGLDGVADPAMAEPVGLLAQVIDADIEPDPDGGGPGIREGVARSGYRFPIPDAPWPQELGPPVSMVTWTSRRRDLRTGPHGRHPGR